MPMTRRSLRSVLSASAIVWALPAAAQDASVYINQVNPTLPVTNARRPMASEQAERVLSNSSMTAGTISPAPDGVGTNLIMPTTNLGTVRNGVSAASLAGNGAGSQSSNVAILSQFGNGNTGTITQGGAGNYALTNVSGSNNATSQTQAGGNGNSSIIGVTGSDNTVTSAQIGTNNNANLTFSGSGYTINSQQNGNGLSYTLSTNQLESGKSITVTQTGIGPGVNSAATPLSNVGILGTPRAR